MTKINVKDISMRPPKPILPLTNVSIPAATIEGSIYWLPVNTQFTLTADVALPDGNYMIMVQQMVDITIPVDDARFVGSVSDGVLTVTGQFSKMGNYVVTQERMNKGLDYIGKPVNLSFDQIEFNVHY